MALSLSQFRDEFPEFDKAPDGIVTIALARALERTPSDVWEDLQDQGQGLLAAHLLTARPEAKEMRNEKGESAYGDERRLLNMVVASGYRITS